MNYIEFTHADKSLYKNIKRETFPNAITMDDIKTSIVKNMFSGFLLVYAKDLLYRINVRDGKFNGEFIKYDQFTPKSLYGSATGLVGGWRQPVMVANFRTGILDGAVTLYRPDGSKQFVFNYNMGLLDGEQKHYIEYSKYVHTFIKGNWDKCVRMSKSWLWSDSTNEVDSHQTVVKYHNQLIIR